MSRDRTADETGHARRAHPAPPIPRARRERLIPEPPSPTRTEFQRDRDRIVHSTAFRRLAHKTQVFVDHDGDHFRTRLTHTIEVAQIARGLARARRSSTTTSRKRSPSATIWATRHSEHTGEEALDACMTEHGGFDHSSHTLRIVTELERRYATPSMELNLDAADSGRPRPTQRAAA